MISGKQTFDHVLQAYSGWTKTATNSGSFVGLQKHRNNADMWLYGFEAQTVIIEPYFPGRNSTSLLPRRLGGLRFVTTMGSSIAFRERSSLPHDHGNRYFKYHLLTLFKNRLK